MIFRSAPAPQRCARRAALSGLGRAWWAGYTPHNWIPPEKVLESCYTLPKTSNFGKFARGLPRETLRRSRPWARTALRAVRRDQQASWLAGVSHWPRWWQWWSQQSTCHQLSHRRRKRCEHQHRHTAVAAAICCGALCGSCCSHTSIFIGLSTAGPGQTRLSAPSMLPTHCALPLVSCTCGTPRACAVYMSLRLVHRGTSLPGQSRS